MILGYCLGATLATIPNWGQLVPDLKIAKNLKDPQLVQDAKDAALRNLAYIPMTGTVVAFSLLDPRGNIVCSIDQNGFVGEKGLQPLAKTPGVLLMTVLLRSFPQGLIRQEHSPQLGRQVGAAIYGFNVRAVLRVASFEALRYGMALPPSMHWWGRYQDDVAACDPYDDILTTETVKQIDRHKVFEYLNLPRSTHPTETLRLAEDARVLADKLNLG